MTIFGGDMSRAVWERDMRALIKAASDNLSEIQERAKVYETTVEKLDDRYLFKRGEWKLTIAATGKGTRTGNSTNGPPFLGIETSADFIARHRPPEYVVDGILQSKMLYSLTGYTGHAKTSLALYLALQIVSGQFFGTAQCAKGSVLILAGENPDNVISQWIAAAENAGVKPDTDKVHWHYGRFDLTENMDKLLEQASKIEDLKLIVTDTLQAFFAGDNDNMQMLAAAKQFRPLTTLKSSPAVLVPCHPSGKQPDRRNLIPRGGGAFLNEVDGNFSIWKDGDGRMTFAQNGKLRGPSFDPLDFVVEAKEFESLKDDRGRVIPMAIVRTLLTDEKRVKAERAAGHLTNCVLYLHENGAASIRDVGEHLGVGKSTAHRIIKEAEGEKLLAYRAKKWKLTADGAEYLRDRGHDPS